MLVDGTEQAVVDARRSGNGADGHGSIGGRSVRRSSGCRWWWIQSVGGGEGGEKEWKGKKLVVVNGRQMVQTKGA